MTWILLNKRLTAIIVLAVLYIIQLGITNHYVKKLNAFADKCASEKQAIIANHKAATDKANADLLDMSNKYEAEKAKEKVIYNETETKVKEIIKTNPIYIDCKLDNSMYEALREATTPRKS